MIHNKETFLFQYRLFSAALPLPAFDPYRIQAMISDVDREQSIARRGCVSSFSLVHITRIVYWHFPKHLACSQEQPRYDDVDSQSCNNWYLPAILLLLLAVHHRKREKGEEWDAQMIRLYQLIEIIYDEWEMRRPRPERGTQGLSYSSSNAYWVASRSLNFTCYIVDSAIRRRCSHILISTTSSATAYDHQ